MLTPEKMLPEWLRVAESRGLESTVNTDDDGTLRALSMKGRVGAAGVTLLYGPAVEREDRVSVGFDGAAEGVFALEARGALKGSREGRLSVRQDPTPTFRKVGHADHADPSPPMETSLSTLSRRSDRSVWSRSLSLLVGFAREMPMCEPPRK